MRKIFYFGPLVAFLLTSAVTVGANQELEETVVDQEIPVIVIETDESPVLMEESEAVETVEELDEEVTDFDSELLVLLQDEDFLTLCATIHYEAGIAATLESKFCVGKVVMNRLNDVDTWGYSSIQDVVYAPRQFSVAHKGIFEKFKDQLARGEFDENALSTVMAAYFVYSGLELCSVDPEVQYFNIDQGLSSWGGHKFAFECGGNAFYFK